MFISGRWLKEPNIKRLLVSLRTGISVVVVGETGLPEIVAFYLLACSEFRSHVFGMEDRELPAERALFFLEKSYSRITPGRTESDLHIHSKMLYFSMYFLQFIS